MIISTELHNEHQDWQIPDEQEALFEFLEEHDKDLSPHGAFTEQVQEILDGRFTRPSGGTSYLVLPVEADADLTIDFKVE